MPNLSKEYKMRCVCILMTLIFAALCFLVKSEYYLLTIFDVYFTDIVRNNLYPRFNLLFLTITRFGDFIVILILTAVSFIVLLICGKVIEAVWLLFGVIGVSGIVVQLLKIIIGRERPDIVHLVAVHDLSFPSGHSTAAMILYGTVILLVNGSVKNSFPKRGVQIFSIMLILGVGVSRIYCGVHFPSDVAGGFLLGLIWLCFSYMMYSKIKVYI